MVNNRFSKKIHSFLIIIVFLMSSYLEVASQTTIRMRREGGVSFIPCKINGLDLSFIFDTGASDVSISLKEALYMIKNGLITERDILGTAYYGDASGNSTKCYVVNIRSLEFAGMKLTNVKASIVNDLNAPLLLGQSALSRIGPIQIDLSTNTLTILNGKGNYDYATNRNNSITNLNKSTEIIEFDERGSAPVDISIRDFEGKSIPNALVIFEMTNTQKKYQVFCDDLGFGTTKLPVGFTYKITFIAKDKINSDKVLDIPMPKGRSYYKDPFKIDIEYTPSRTFILEDCEYSKNEYLLNSDNYTRLNKVVDYMTAYPNSIIFLTGVANRSENNKLKLLENRIRPIMNYLLGHGIDSSRIKVNRSSILNSNTKGMVSVDIDM